MFKEKNIENRNENSRILNLTSHGSKFDKLIENFN